MYKNKNYTTNKRANVYICLCNVLFKLQKELIVNFAVHKLGHYII